MPTLEPATIKNIIDNLISADNETIVALKRELKEIENNLEQKKMSLNDLQSSLDEFQNKLVTIKNKNTSFKKSFKEVIAEGYEEYFSLLGLDIDLSGILSMSTEAAGEFSKGHQIETSRLKELIKQIKPEIATLENQLKIITEKLQDNSYLQKLLQDYIKSAQNNELDITKKEIIQFLSQFKDINNKFLFDKESLPIAAQIVMFAENFKFGEEKVTSIAETIKNARELEPIEEEKKEDNEEFEIKPIVFDEVEVNTEEPKISEVETKVVSIEPLKISDEKEINLTDIIEGNEELYSVSEEKEEIEEEKEKTKELTITPEEITTLLEKADNDMVGHGAIDIKDFQETVNYLEDNGVDLSNLNHITMYFPKENLEIFVQNYKYITDVLGIEGNFKKNPVSLAIIPTNELISRLDIAKKYGYQIKSVQDIVALCRYENISVLFDEAVEKLGANYENQIKSSTLFNVIEFLHKGYEKITESILKEKFGDLVENVKAVENNPQLGPTEFFFYSGAMELMEEVKELPATKYSYIVENGDQEIHISKSRIENNLKKIATLNASEDIGSLLTLACLLGSTKNQEEIDAIVNKILSEAPKMGGR